MAPIRIRLVTIVTLLAFVAAAIGPLLPERASAATQPCAMMGDMTDHHDGSSQPMSMPACGSDTSCIVMCALPTTAEPSATRIAWANVGYWASVAPLVGVTITPDPSPPRSRI